MSAQPEDAGSGKKPEIRRAVALPAVDTEASPGLAPAREPAPEAQPGDRPPGTDPAPRPASGALVRRSPEGGAPAVWEAGRQDQPAVPDAGDDGGAPPGRPAKMVVAAALGGAALLAVPFLLVGSGTPKGTEHPRAVTNAAADGTTWRTAPSTSASPSSSGTPSASATPSAPPRTVPAPVAGTTPARRHSGPSPKRPPSVPAIFGGATDMLLKNLGTGLCADLPDFGNGSVNGPVNEYYCQPGSGDNQMWTLQVVDAGQGPGGARLFTIRNVKDEMCMDLPYYGDNPAGTPVSEFGCAPTTKDNQLWYLAYGDQNHYRIRNLASHGLCLGVKGGPGAGPDARLIIEPCGSTADDWAWTSG